MPGGSASVNLFDKCLMLHSLGVFSFGVSWGLGRWGHSSAIEHLHCMQKVTRERFCQLSSDDIECDGLKVGIYS